MRRLSAILTLVLLLSPVSLPGQRPNAEGGGSTASEPVAIRTHTRFYDIAGNTAEELWNSIRARGPRQSAGRYAGYTDVQLGWDFRYAPDASGCRITQAQVRASIDMQLPRWTPPGGADPELVQRWARFARALRQHEEGHRSLGMESAHAAHRALLAVRTPSCDAIGAAADAAAAQVGQEYTRRAQRYDQHTGYGRTQGAAWFW